MNVTGITVVFNTPHLLNRALNSVRKFYPHLPLTVVNNSTDGTQYKREDVSFYQIRRNMQHGPALHYALERCKTKYALIFDSDIEMIRGGVVESMRYHVQGKEFYGIGHICHVNELGHNINPKEYAGIKYLHPFFALMDVNMYLSYPRAVHHGAPMIKAMQGIHDAGKADLLIDFPVGQYVRHKGRGTRRPREFYKNWEK